MGEYLSFRRFITPAFIQLFFWLGVVGVVIVSIMTMARGDIGGFVGGLMTLVLGIIAVRVYCELLILLFRIYEELVMIRTGGSSEPRGFAVVPPETLPPR